MVRELKTCFTSKLAVSLAVGLERAMKWPDLEKRSTMVNDSLSLPAGGWWEALVWLHSLQARTKEHVPGTIVGYQNIFCEKVKFG